MTIRPSTLRYRHGEHLSGGAQYMSFNFVDDLEAYWTNSKCERPFACRGTGSTEPAVFLRPHEWIFAPSKEALVSAVTRWDTFQVVPRWCDLLAEELEVLDEMDAERAARRLAKMTCGTWSPAEEQAFLRRSEEQARTVVSGYWRLMNLPFGLSHFDWLSELAPYVDDPNLDPNSVSLQYKRITFDDWSLHQTQDGVFFMTDAEVREEISSWRHCGST